VPLENLWRLAVPWYANRLDHNWTPRTADAMETLFGNAGLTGEFWRLDR
jgi:hypothetical protein